MQDIKVTSQESSESTHSRWLLRHAARLRQRHVRVLAGQTALWQQMAPDSCSAEYLVDFCRRISACMPAAPLSLGTWIQGGRWRAGLFGRL